jgi:hypothetical protein
MQGRRASLTPARWLLQYYARLLVTALSLASALVAGSASAYSVEVDAPAPLKKIFEQFLDIARYKDRADLNEDQFNFMVGDVEQQVKELAATEGYFSPQTQVRVDRAGATVIVRIAVTLGPRSLISSVHLEVEGAAPAASPQQVGELRRTWSLPVGNPFRQEDWSAAKENGLRILRDRNFASARIVDSRATIDPAAMVAVGAALLLSREMLRRGCIHFYAVGTCAAGEKRSRERQRRHQQSRVGLKQPARWRQGSAAAVHRWSTVRLRKLAGPRVTYSAPRMVCKYIHGLRLDVYQVESWRLEIADPTALAR